MTDQANLVSSINFATMQINRYAAAFVLLFGTVGNLLNVCVLNERSLIENPCSIYLFWSSASSIVFLWSGLLTRVLQGFNVNWPNQNEPVCKLRIYFLNVSWMVAAWAIVGASIDRYLCSSVSVRHRQLSTTRTARRFLIAVFIFAAILFLEVFYCYAASVPNVPVACYSRNLPCRLFNDWTTFLVEIVGPSVVLAVFGALTIRQIRTRGVYPMTNPVFAVTTMRIGTRTRQSDRNLSRMLLVQVFVFLVLGFPFGIYRPYASLTSNLPKNALRVAIENLIYAQIILLIFFTYTTSFYLYTLTGSIFRDAFKHMGQRWLHSVHPRF